MGEKVIQEITDIVKTAQNPFDVDVGRISLLLGQFFLGVVACVCTCIYARMYIHDASVSCLSVYACACMRI